MKVNPTYNDSDIGYLDEDFSEKETSKNIQTIVIESTNSDSDYENKQSENESKEV